MRWTRCRTVPGHRCRRCRPSRSVAVASSPTVRERICSAVAPSCRSIHRTTVRMGRDSSAPRGAGVRAARSPVRSNVAPRRPRDADSRRARRIDHGIGCLHRGIPTPAVVNGDQPTRSRDAGHSISPLGSKRKAHPFAHRAGAVASITSGLVDVETTGPSGQQNIGDDQGGCLSRARRSKHERRSLRTRPRPSAFANSEVDVVRVAPWRARVDPVIITQRVRVGFVSRDGSIASIVASRSKFHRTLFRNRTMDVIVCACIASNCDTRSAHAI
jgi:hypothetical protein